MSKVVKGGRLSPRNTFFVRNGWGSIDSDIRLKLLSKNDICLSETWMWIGAPLRAPFPEKSNFACKYRSS